MGIFFSKRKSVSRITEQDKVILQLKSQRDNLKKYQCRIEKTMDCNKSLVKKLLADGKKERAKLLLKKKRYQEALLEKTDNILQNLEKLAEDIEFAQIDSKVVEGLKLGNDALKKLNEALNVEDIEKILDETKEGIDKQKEISDLISGDFLDVEDDEIIDAELSRLIEQENVTPKLPEVPDNKLIDPTSKKKKRLETEALES